MSLAQDMWNVHEVTHAQLLSLISGNWLIPFDWYLITDYQTIHGIPNSVDINTWPIEPIYVMALNQSELHSIAYSSIHKSDILYYNALDVSINVYSNAERTLAGWNTWIFMLVSDVTANTFLINRNLYWDVGFYLTVFDWVNWYSITSTGTGLTAIEESPGMYRYTIDTWIIWPIDLTQIDSSISISWLVNYWTRPGWIYYRKDTERSIEKSYDWRNVMFRRYWYTYDAPEWNIANTYEKWMVVFHINPVSWLKYLYVSDKDNNIWNTPSTSWWDRNWILLWAEDSFYNKYILSNTSHFFPGTKLVSDPSTSFSLNIDYTEFKDYYLFDDWANNIPDVISNVYNTNKWTYFYQDWLDNNVIIFLWMAPTSWQWIEFKELFKDNTFILSSWTWNRIAESMMNCIFTMSETWTWSDINNCTFGNSCSQIFCVWYMYWVNFNWYCDNITITNWNQINDFENCSWLFIWQQCNWLIFKQVSWFISSRVVNTKIISISSSISDVIIWKWCYENNIEWIFTTFSLWAGSMRNIFNWKFSNVSLWEWCDNNILYWLYVNVTIWNVFTSNEITEWIWSTVIWNNFSNNNIRVIWNATIWNNFSNNKFWYIQYCNIWNDCILNNMAWINDISNIWDNFSYNISNVTISTKDFDILLHPIFYQAVDVYIKKYEWASVSDFVYEYLDATKALQQIVL